jgi:cbb3-type cytochrome oxidase subunit 3
MTLFDVADWLLLITFGAFFIICISLAIWVSKRKKRNN